MAVQQRKKEKGMRLRYKNRKTNIMKKGEELSTLCDVKVCVIVVSPDGKLETWPENLNDVKAVLSAIKGSSKPVRSEHNPKKKKGHKDLPKPITVNDVADVKGKDICIGNADQENNVEDKDITMINNPNSFCHNPTIGEMHESLEDHGVSIWSAEMGVPDMVVNECPTMSMVVNHQELSSNYGNQQEIGGSSAMNSNFTYHAYEIGSSSCIISGVTCPLFDESLGVDIWSGGMGVPNNMVLNQEVPLSDVSLGVDIWSDVLNQQPSSQYGNQQIGGNSAMNSSFAHYDQFEIGSSSGYTCDEIGSCSYINSGMAHPNQPPFF